MLKLYSTLPKRAALFFLLLFFVFLKDASACLPQIYWGSSVSFCQGNSFTLNAFNQNSTYLWNTGAASAQITVTTSGIYWVSVTNNCGTVSDTIEVKVDAPIFLNLGADRAYCSSSPEILSVPFYPNASYLWQNGSTSNQFVATQPGTYFVKISNACGAFSDTVVLEKHFPQNLNFGSDQIICNSQNAVLKIDSNISGSVLWNDGSTADSIIISQSGQYWARVTNACGITTDTIQFDFVQTQSLLPLDTLWLCPGSSVTVGAMAKNLPTQWSTGSNLGSINISQTGTFWLTQTSNCGILSDTFHVLNSPQALVDLGPDTSGCFNFLSLDAGNIGGQYLWNTGQTTQTLFVNQSAKYWVGVDNGCGFVYDTINVQKEIIPNPNLDDTIYLCASNPTEILDAGSFGGNTTFLWSNGDTTQLATYTTTGFHWVQVSNNCGTETDSFFVKTIQVPIFNLGNDTSFCGKNIGLSPFLQMGGNTFLWSDSSSGPYIKVNSSGWAWLTVTNVCGSFTDSIYIGIRKNPARLLEDTIVGCANSGVWIATKYNSTVSYRWNTGDTTDRVFVTQPGKYWLFAYNECDSMADTAYVYDMPPLQFDLGKDTTFCRPHKLLLNLSHLEADSIIWSNGSRADSIIVTQNGTYWVRAYNVCGIVSDTISVIINPMPKSVLKDTSFCAGTSVVLDASSSQATQFLWNTGSISPQISVTTPGWYYVDLTNECGFLRDSVLVTEDQPLPKIDLGNDTIFCAGAITLDPGFFPNAKYMWQSGFDGQQYMLSTTGTYYVSVSNSCNTVWDTINILVTGPPVLALGTVVKFCQGSSIFLNAQNPGSDYLWSTGDTIQGISIGAPGKYWVTITNDCGSLTDTVDVQVEVPLTDFSLGNDTVICQGDSVLLDVQIAGANAKWKNGNLSSAKYIKQTGDYWVQVSNSCGSWSDTLHVEVLDVPVFTLGADKMICSDGGSTTLAGPIDLHYLWNTGDTLQDLAVRQAGIYWLTVSNMCFSFTDTVEVLEEHPLNFDFGLDQVLCHGETFLLDPGILNYDVIWNDGRISPIKEITRGGTFWAKAENSCGVFSDTISIRFEKPLAPETEDTIICSGDSALFFVNQKNIDFHWFDGLTDSVRSFEKAGDYPIFIQNKCGSFEKIFRVKESFCECPFFIANAFTPNGDGHNDRFEIGHSCDLTFFEMKIFNRWGEEVFHTKNHQKSWDGNHNGKESAGGIYTYSIVYGWNVYQVEHQETVTGTLTLMR